MFGPAGIVLVEFKLTYWEEVWEQVVGLYQPLIEEVYPGQLVALSVVVRNLGLGGSENSVGWSERCELDGLAVLAGSGTPSLEPPRYLTHWLGM